VHVEVKVRGSSSAVVGVAACLVHVGIHGHGRGQEEEEEGTATEEEEREGSHDRCSAWSFFWALARLCVRAGPAALLRSASLRLNRSWIVGVHVQLYLKSLT